MFQFGLYENTSVISMVDRMDENVSVVQVYINRASPYIDVAQTVTQGNGSPSPFAIVSGIFASFRTSINNIKEERQCSIAL